jgi:hypothetical protein
MIEDEEKSGVIKKYTEHFLTLTAITLLRKNIGLIKEKNK